jgi:hypothetical protein
LGFLALPIGGLVLALTGWPWLFASSLPAVLAGVGLLSWPAFLGVVVLFTWPFFFKMINGGVKTFLVSGCLASICLAIGIAAALERPSEGQEQAEEVRPIIKPCLPRAIAREKRSPASRRTA